MRLWLMGLYAAGVAVATMQRGVWSREHTTFTIFRQSFTHLVRHQNLYAAYPAEQGAAAADLFKYSPTAAVLFAPLAMLPYSVALFAWNLLNVGLLFYALVRLLPPARANLALLLLAPEVFVAVQSSSSNALVAALIVLAAVAYEEGRFIRAGYAVVVGAAIKIFPLACFIFAVRKQPRRAAITAVAAFLAVLSLPLLVISPRELLQQYEWWVMLEGTDARDMMFGMSLMRQLRDWLELEWPNWIMQLIGTAFFLLPLALRHDRWRRADFRLQYLCSLLIFVVLFNHQAERQSFVIAATGCVLWFVSGRRTLEGGVLLMLALLGVPILPYLALWLVIHLELLWGTPTLAPESSPVFEEMGDLPVARRYFTGRYRRAS